MPTQNYYANHLGCLHLRCNALASDKVTINDSTMPLQVTNDAGELIFYVDNSGANVRTINSVTKLSDLQDTPNSLGSDNSILMVKGDKLAYSDVLNIASVNVCAATTSQIDTNVLNAGDASITHACIGSLQTQATVTQSLISTSLSCNDVECSTLKAEALDFLHLKATSLKASQANITDISSSTGSCV